MDFGYILELDECCIPWCFVQWIADHVSTKEEKIKIGCRSILLSPESVADTLGSSSGQFLVDTDEESGKAAFLEIFG